MSGSSPFKILPLLVFVAMLAFSVRLADVVNGFSSLTAQAYAESGHAEEMPMEEDAADGDQGGGGLVFAEEDEKDAPEEESSDPATEEEDLPINWREQGEPDLGYMAVQMDLFKDLSKRREEIETKERALHTREALLQATEKELDRKYQELSLLRGEIEKLLETQSEEEQARIKSLVKIYEGMKPKDAARIFDTLDLDILVSVMSKMSERKLSPILANMNPERARTITIMLAEQKQLPSLPQSN